jgi:hypothetical protein
MTLRLYKNRKITSARRMPSNVKSSSEKPINLTTQSTPAWNFPPNHGVMGYCLQKQGMLDCARTIKCLIFVEDKPRKTTPGLSKPTRNLAQPKTQRLRYFGIPLTSIRFTAFLSTHLETFSAEQPSTSCDKSCAGPAQSTSGGMT